jgi:hypothetical protein
MNIVYEYSGSFNPGYAKSQLLSGLVAHANASGSIDRHFNATAKFQDGWRLKLEISARGTSSLSTRDEFTHDSHKVSMNLGSGSFNVVQIDNQGGHEDVHKHHYTSNSFKRDTQPYNLSGSVDQVSNLLLDAASGEYDSFVSRSLN